MNTTLRVVNSSRPVNFANMTYHHEFLNFCCKLTNLTTLIHLHLNNDNDNNNNEYIYIAQNKVLRCTNSIDYKTQHGNDRNLYNFIFYTT